MGSPQQVEQKATVLTSIFQIRGVLRVLGNLQTFMNDDTRPTMSVFNTSILGSAVSNPAAQMNQAEMVVNKRDCEVVIFEGTIPPGSFAVPPRIESLVMYTDHYAVMGKFPMGQDARIGDFAATGISQFVIVQEFRIFPMFQARPGIVTAGTIGAIHKNAIRTYHKA